MERVYDIIAAWLWGSGLSEACKNGIHEWVAYST